MVRKTKREKVNVAIRHTSVLITLAILALAIYGITNIGPINEETSFLINRYGIPGLFIISLFLDLIPQIISPIVALAAGMIAGINIYYAIIATILGSAVGSTLSFIIGKKYMFDAVDILTTKTTTDRLTHLTNKYGKIIIPIAAISPLPYLPVVLGTMNFSRKNFIIFGLVPRAISIAVYGILFSFI